MTPKSLDLRDFRYLLDEEAEVEEIDVADYSDEVKRLINACETTTKFRSCVQKAQELLNRGRTVIIWCVFINTINCLAEALQAQGVAIQCIFGEVPLDQRQQILLDFKAGNFQVLITNPHTLAESVSLHSICHDAIYFEYSYNLIHLLQSKDRIHRLGLPQEQYMQYYSFANRI